MSTFRAWILVAVAVLGVSTSGPVTAGTLAPVVAIAFWRNVAGAGVSGTWALLRDRPGFGALTARRFWLSVFSGLVLATHFTSWFAGLRLTSVAAATALCATTPIYTVAFDLVRRVPVPRAVLIGVAVSMLGVVSITGVDAGRSAQALAGDLLSLYAAGAMGVYVLTGERVMRTTSPALYTLIAYASCALVLLPTALLTGTPLTGLSTRSWIEIGVVTVGAQVLGHTLINVTLPTLGATPVSLAILFEVPGAALLAWAWLGEAPPLAVLPGAVLMLAGLVVVVRSRRAPAPAEVLEPAA
ncbi:DMT family transporter [Kineosporia sp. J2-2]|uniref:DMT family transporter n=1 Tax=Kineosporia corallincola TaxID=2835133 RepID=A0ABS5TJL5_9ACTN|nr:DMT family transporter [Kineosporia corallincola]MBT0770396.1 DMT family transporter [Kineosporia corallincola]